MKPTTSTVVTEEDWITAVIIAPANAAVKRLAVSRARRFFMPLPADGWRWAPDGESIAFQYSNAHGIPVTNVSVNPARSTGPALFVGGWALSQLWLFWVAPIIGGLLGGGIYRWLGGQDE